MKYLLPLFTLFLSSVEGQVIPMKDGKAVYQFVDSSLNQSKDDIFMKAKLWLAESFRDAKSVIQLDDKEAGELAGKGNFAFGMMASNTCHFTIKISCRDNKYRLQVYDFLVQQGTMGPRRPVEDMIGKDGSGRKKIQENIDEEIKKLYASLKEKVASRADSF